MDEFDLPKQKQILNDHRLDLELRYCIHVAMSAKVVWIFIIYSHWAAYSHTNDQRNGV